MDPLSFSDDACATSGLRSDCPHLPGISLHVHVVRVLDLGLSKLTPDYALHKEIQLIVGSAPKHLLVYGLELLS